MEEEKASDASSIHDYIMKMQASNTYKALIGSVIVKLTLKDKIIKKKSPQGLDSFYNSRKEIDNIHYDHSQNQLQSTNSSDISSSFFIEATLRSIN